MEVGYVPLEHAPAEAFRGGGSRWTHCSRENPAGYWPDNSTGVACPVGLGVEAG